MDQFLLVTCVICLPAHKSSEYLHLFWGLSPFRGLTLRTCFDNKDAKPVAQVYDKRQA